MASRKSSTVSHSDRPSAHQVDAVMRKFEELSAQEQLLRERANEIVTRKMWWAAGVGLLPFPIIDWAAATGLQVSMINNLAELFARTRQPPVSKQTVHKWVSSLAGGFVPTYLKAVPGLGMVAGILTAPLFY